MDEKIIELLKKADALLEGHFQLASGKHSSKYVQCAKVFEYPEISKMICKKIAKLWKNEKPDIVIGPALGAVIFAYELAYQLNAKAMFSERKEGKMMIKRNFQIGEKERILVVEDVVTTGGSIIELLDVLKGKNIIGISSIIDRSKQNPFEGHVFRPLIKLDLPAWMPEKCPLCKDNIPLYTPGTKKSN